MNPADIVSKALSNDVLLFLKDGGLSYKTTSGNKISDELRAQIVEHKAQIIEYLQVMENKVNEGIALPRIKAREEGADAPLSYAQRQLLFLSKLEEGSHQYNIQGVLHIQGQLNISVLEFALNSILERHLGLRTNFVEFDGEFFQFLNTEPETPLEQIFLKDKTPEEANNIVKEVIQQDAEQSFDLEQDVLLRVKLLHQPDETYTLVFCMHHIASDGWSLGVFVREFSELYRAKMNEQAPQLPALDIQYADYASWQAEILSGELKDKAMAFWRDNLHQVPELHALPLDKPRSADSDFSAIKVQQVIPKVLTEQLKNIANEYQVTLFMLLQTAFSVLLHRSSQSQDIVMGSPMSGRVDEGLSGLIGLFINTVVIRNHIDPAQSFIDLLQANKSNLLKIHENQFIPFDILVSELDVTRSSTHSPLFQIWFVFQNNEQVKIELPDCQITVKNEDIVDSAKYELNIYITESEAGMEIAWVARSALFEQETIAFYQQEFASLLSQIAATPEQRIVSFQCFTATAASQSLLNSDWVVSEEDVLEAFLNIATKQPEQIAIVGVNEQITYQELHQKSQGLAAVLRKREHGNVGIYLSHGPQPVVAMMAALMAQKAFVFLDKDYPESRLQYMLRDAWIEMLIIDQSKAELADWLQTYDLVSIHDSASLHSDAMLPSLANQPAYILYTSGSSGHPKGVMQPRASLAYHINAYRHILDIGVNDHMLQTAPFGHDAAIVDVIAALSAGACLYPVDVKQLSRDEVRERITHQITVYHSPASVFKYLFSDFDLALQSSLRAVVFGGEKVDSATLALAAKCLPSDCQLMNLYGSTEATFVGYSVWPVSDLSERAKRWNRLLPGTQVSIVDDQGQATDLYQEGEIQVTSQYVADQYLNLPELTREKFIPQQEGYTTYLTGDVGRLFPDGSVLITGRKDSQVKINAMRIEPEEIESVLLQQPEVEEAVVVATEGVAGEQVIVAYVVLQSRSETDTDICVNLHNQLKSALPSFMVPASVLAKEALEKTHSGKLDRKTMSQWVLLADASQENIQADSEVEARILKIWQMALNKTDFGVTDDFFAMGGNSIKSLSIISQINASLGIKISLKEFFDARNVRQLANIVCSRSAEEQHEPVLAHDAEHRYEPFPLTSIQQAYWLGRSDNFELGSVATQGYVEHDIRDYNHANMQRALNLLIERHDMLRMLITVDGQQRIQAEVPQYIPVEYAFHLASEAELEQHLRALRHEMSSQVRSVHKWPIFDFRVTYLPNNIGRLHVCTDALIMDARSRAIIVYELLKLYRDVETSLPPLEITFRDYVLAEEQQRDTEAFRQAKEYWMARLESLPDAPALPIVKDPSLVKKTQFERRDYRVSVTAWQKLQQQAKDYAVTPTNLIIAYFSKVLGYWCESRDFTLNLTVFNRQPLHPQVESLVGDFTASSLLQIDGSRAESFQQLAQIVHHQLFEDLDNRLFNGVEVLRELVAIKGRPRSAIMPVVFTGLVGFNSLSDNALELDRESTVFGATQTSQVYLDCQVYDDEDSISVTWNCVDELFAPGVLKAMFSAFCESLEEPSRLEHLLPTEQSDLYAKVNATQADFPDKRLHELFIEQVQRTPERIAVVNKDIRQTYRALDELSTLYAQKLIDQKIKANEHVAVLMRKGWEQVVACYAILKAGSAYLPIDAALPENRIQLLLESTGVSVVLKQPSVDFVANDSALNVIDVKLLEVPDSLPIIGLRGQTSDLAYTIFTSGSTGKPKGVMIDHRGAVNTILDINQRFNVTQEDTVFAISELNFDLSVYDIFGLLAVGGKVVIPAQEDNREPAKWTELVKAEGVTIWNSVPALVNLWVDAESEKLASTSLRLVMMSGDWIPLDVPEKLWQQQKELEVYSLGGATEASIWSIFYPVCEVLEHWTSIPYGKPLSNQTFHILNDELEPCPVWVGGDLFIGGTGVALGYFADEEKTNESFIRHPKTQQRLYRTGDRGRYLPDGNIEFLGRIDNQVKIHGYRIETGEIEAYLMKENRVKQALVLALGERNNMYLVAYLVFADEVSNFDDGLLEQELANEFIAYLGALLPRYMVPELYVAIDRVPMSANGKVDRGQLPDIQKAYQTDDGGFVAPEGALEEEIAALWMDMLNRESVSATDNFFAIGGNSILAVRIIMELRERYHLDNDSFQFNQFFSAASVREIALLVQSLQPLSLSELSDLAEDDELESGVF